MSPRLRSLLTQVGGFVLAAVLLWLALRGLDWSELRHALRTAHYGWVPILVVILLLSHWLRAWRWTMLMDGLPPEPGARRVGTPFAFAALMVGYMVNYGAPRLGEVARTTAVAREGQRPFSAVLGTVVLERLLDVAVLGLGLLTVPLLLGSRLMALADLFVLPANPFLWLALASVAVLTGFLGLWWLRGHARRQHENSWWHRRVWPLIQSFRAGLATIATSPHRRGLIATTAAIWVLYAFAAWLPFLLLGSAQPYGIGLIDGWCIMLIGAIGMVVPTPGGAGSYHYVTIQTLGLLYGMHLVDAQVYAVFAHGAQLVLYALTGAVCLIALARHNRSRRRMAVQVLT